MNNTFEYTKARLELIKMKVEIQNTLATWEMNNGMNMPKEMRETLQSSLTEVIQSVSYLEQNHGPHDQQMKKKIKAIESYNVLKERVIYPYLDKQDRTTSSNSAENDYIQDLMEDVERQLGIRP